jgi:hypothetical protein
MEGEACRSAEFQLQRRIGDLVCAKIRSPTLNEPTTPTAFQWLVAPFSTGGDVVGYLPDAESEVFVSVSGVNLVAVGAEGPVEEVGSESVWCFWTTLANHAVGLTISTSTFDYQLLDSSGALSPPMYLDFGVDGDFELDSGQLEPLEFLPGFICFDRPDEAVGRFGLVFWPNRYGDWNGDVRAIFYFDQ